MTESIAKLTTVSQRTGRRGYLTGSCLILVGTLQFVLTALSKGDIQLSFALSMCASLLLGCWILYFESKKTYTEVLRNTFEKTLSAIIAICLLLLVGAVVLALAVLSSPCGGLDCFGAVLIAGPLLLFAAFGPLIPLALGLWFINLRYAVRKDIFYSFVIVLTLLIVGTTVKEQHSGQQQADRETAEVNSANQLFKELQAGTIIWQAYNDPENRFIFEFFGELTAEKNIAPGVKESIILQNNQTPEEIIQLEIFAKEDFFKPSSSELHHRIAAELTKVSVQKTYIAPIDVYGLTPKGERVKINFAKSEFSKLPALTTAFSTGSSIEAERSSTRYFVYGDEVYALTWYSTNYYTAYAGGEILEHIKNSFIFKQKYPDTVYAAAQIDPKLPWQIYTDPQHGFSFEYAAILPVKNFSDIIDSTSRYRVIVTMGYSDNEFATISVRDKDAYLKPYDPKHPDYLPTELKEVTENYNGYTPYGHIANENSFSTTKLRFLGLPALKVCRRGMGTTGRESILFV